MLFVRILYRSISIEIGVCEDSAYRRHNMGSELSNFGLSDELMDTHFIFKRIVFYTKIIGTIKWLPRKSTSSLLSLGLMRH